MIGFVVLSIVGPIVAAKLNSDFLNPVSVSYLLGSTVGAIWIVYVIYYLLPDVFVWSVSLPLHVCDVLAPVAVIALLLKHRLARGVLSLCSLPFAMQAIVTPTGDQDPTIFRFWIYWLLHAGIISAFFYDYFIMKFRPVLSDLWRVVLVNISYIAVIMSINLSFDWNYGYVGNSKPSTPTAVDFLGPWPERVFFMFLIAVSLQTIMFLVLRERSRIA